jgi:hypothetical protein
MKADFEEGNPNMQQADPDQSQTSSVVASLRQLPGQLRPEEQAEIAKEVFKGCDEVYQSHMDRVTGMFKESKTQQKEREYVLKQSAEIS